jgi:PKD repeat protein
VLLFAGFAAWAQESEALQKEDSLEFDVKPVNINSNAGDFSPLFRAGEIYFVSGRPRQGSVKFVDRNQRSDITDIYIARKTGNGFGKARPFDAVNSAYHEGPFCLDSKGSVMYFTGTDKKTGLLKIFRTQKDEGKWSRPHALEICNSKHTFCHPALINDSLIVFSSDLDSANGMDLYIAQMRGGICDTAVNFGARTNTGANELFPYFFNDQLYFASNRTGGLGGLDIYSIALNEPESKVKALKFPINSPVDDFGICFESNNKGYFSSNRVAGSGDDIFSFTRVIPDFSVAKPPPITLCYYFYEENASKLKDTVNFLFQWHYGDDAEGSGIRTRHCYAKPGDYQVTLDVTNKKTNEVAAHVSYTLNVPDPELLTIHCSDTVELGQLVPIRGNVALKGFKVNNTYWSFGDGKFNRSLEVQHQYRKPGKYNVEMLVEAVHRKTSNVELFKVSREITVVEKGDE